jgi:integrase
MAKPKNRSPWVVKLAKQNIQKFRLKSQALAFLAENGHANPKDLPKGALKQLETAFEVQVIRKDKEGNVVRRSETFDTYEDAEKYAARQDAELARILQTQGGFEVGYETITVKEALEKFHAEHYKDKASFRENGYRIPYLVEWLGGARKFRDLNKKDFQKFKDTLEAEKYSASSQRNFFTILTSLYKHARRKWLYPVDNPASDMDLPKPKNYVERDFRGDERERLFKSLQAHSPWMIPIVETSLELTFRRGELVQSEKSKKTGIQSGGLQWEGVDWERGLLNFDKQNNDGSKPVSESLGRTVPLTPRLREILRPLYDASPTKSGLVFQGTINSVSGAFSNACKLAEPPIKKLTFHSLRKISTKATSKRVNNAMELRRLTGHKNVEVLDKRYYDVQVEELAALLMASSGSVKHRGVAALTKVLGLEDAKKFLSEVRELKELDDLFK